MSNIHYCTIKQDDYLERYSDYCMRNIEMQTKFKKEMEFAFFPHQKRKVAYDHIRELLRIEHKYGDFVKYLDEQTDAKINELKLKYNLSENKVSNIFINEHKEKSDIYIYTIGEKNEETVFDLDKYLENGAKGNKTDYILDVEIDDEILENKMLRAEYEVPLNKYVGDEIVSPMDYEFNEYRDNELSK